MVNANISDTSINRAWRVGKLAVGLAGSYLGYQLQDRYLGEEDRTAKRKAFHQSASKRVREELQSLKGPIMKIGQMLSMQSHALPEEVVRELTHLQMRAPAMHPTLVRSQFKASFGRYPETVFRMFDPVPFAAASLGQVHRATTKDGDSVAVKIQYPGIRQAIKNDFRLLKTASLPGRLTGHTSPPMIDELERGVLEETDYVREAENLEFFRDRLAALSYVRLPEVFPKLSTDRILTMSLLDGTHLDEFLAGRPIRNLRRLVGKRLLELFLFQKGRVHSLHADPHPGNYLFDKEGRIGLVDFGCVKSFSKNFIELERCFTERVWVRSDKDFERMVRLTWGTDTMKQNRHARLVMREAIRFCEMVFPGPESKSTEVDFGDAKLILSLTRIWNESLRKKLTNPEFIFYSRAELGLYNILHRLDVKLDTVNTIRNLERLALPKPAD